MPANVLSCLAGLGYGVVTIPVLLDGRFGIIKRTVVIMGTFAHPPEIKALPSFFRYIFCSAMTVNVPFADIAGFVTGLAINLADSDRIGIQGLIVVENAVSKPVLPGQKACTIWTANRTTRDGVAEIDAFLSKSIKIRRLYSFIARIPGRLGAPLIREQIKDVGFRG